MGEGGEEGKTSLNPGQESTTSKRVVVIFVERGFGRGGGKTLLIGVSVVPLGRIRLGTEKRGGDMRTLP